MVSERALLQRINRKLDKDYQKVCKTRTYYERDGSGPYYEVSLGQYYLVDTHRNFMVQTHVDLEELGREVGVLSQIEQVA
jgi:hypothetical protein